MDSLVVAAVSDFRNHHCCCTFSILSMSCLKCGDQNSPACSGGGRNMDLCNGRISTLFLPEITGNEPQYSVSRIAAFLCLCLPHEVFDDDS